VLTACPICQSTLATQRGAKKLGEVAEAYKDCRRICQRCGIGLSNATSRPTFIRRDWRDGLWRRRAAARLLRIVAGSLNERSRGKKIIRLANERSEDLLTWNYFSWLENHQRLGKLLRFIGAPNADDTVRLFYWGANDGAELEDLRLQRLFKELLKTRFQEDPARFSEPDILLIEKSHIVLIEAKLDSPNDLQPDHPRIDKYVRAVPEWFVSPSDVQRAGYYELTRNWAVGAVLAAELGRTFTLVNLVRGPRERDIERKFGALLTDKGNFKRMTWEDCAKAVEPATVQHLRRQTLYFEPAFPGLVP
jgi:hypothetical protein